MTLSRSSSSSSSSSGSHVAPRRSRDGPTAAGPTAAGPTAAAQLADSRLGAPPQQSSSPARSQGRRRRASARTADVKASASDRVKSALHQAVSLDREAPRGDKRGTKRIRIIAPLVALYRRCIVEGLFRLKTLPPTKNGRHIPLNPRPGPESNGGLVDERTDKPYVSNFIRSSRYTPYDFLPKQLLFQFSKLGNFYFLVMGILQMVPGLSTVGRWTTVVPLSIFVAFSMAKEGLDDYRRYQLDKAENRSQAWVLASDIQRRQGKAMAGTGTAAKQTDQSPDWLSVQWQDVRVGDVVRLCRDQAVPADMVLLHASGPNGVAYIETMALDGETNLKSKQACPLLAERCATVDGIKSTVATVISEDPNPDLYSYDAKVVADGQALPLALANMVYRGSTLRNTAQAVGLVVNSGEECKIRINAHKHVGAKKPAMQSIINKMVLFQIVIVCALAGGLTAGYYLWDGAVEKHSFYLVHPGSYDASVSFREVFFGYLIMFNTLIPLSLYISMEIVKLGQLVLMQDVHMYDPVTDTPMVANTTTILENLGQVTHVFSDKTGTLTENLMRFRKLSVAGVACFHDMDVQGDEQARSNKVEAVQKRAEGKGRSTVVVPQEKTIDKDGEPGSDVGGLPAMASSVRRSPAGPGEQAEMKTEALLDYIRQRPNTTFSRKARHLLLCIALCHTCLPEAKDGGGIEFQAASPDELALVEAARDLGLVLVDRPAQSITLQIRDAEGGPQLETYQVLDVIDFSSRRKRMSVIVRTPDGRICVICKGADNVIMSRLKLSHLAEQKARDIGRRASLRKTFEQDKAMRRMSEQASAWGTPRTSFALGRAETGDQLEGLRRSFGRQSTDFARHSLSEGVASWAINRRQRATEEAASPRASANLLRSPRPSLSRVPSVDGMDCGGVVDAVAANEAVVFEKCFQHVDDFACEGLRTLLYAYRYVDEETYARWKQLYREAETSLVDRQRLIEEAGEQIETKLELAGATAIEDKLQDGVAETIDKLRRANVKVWMLTGDKRETAINIGHSARLCKPFSETYILDGTAGGGRLRDALQATLNDVCRGMVPHSVVVVDGQTLGTIDGDEQLRVLFSDLVVRVDSVICCRASPSQKAELVKAIRRRLPGSMTLAIGDGANDIGMIQASHVGIGISGREGLQAARIADYSIAQFRFLQRLLLVHGRWNYIRTGKYVLATFWKEIVFFLVQAHYQRLDGYSGTSLFESWSLTVFNSAFTSLPVILLGIFERDLAAETLLAVPELYTFGQRGLGFNYAQYLGWIVMGVAGSVAISHTVFGLYAPALFTIDTSLFAMGDVCFTVAVVYINIKLLILELHSKTVVTFAGFFISVAGWFAWNVVLSAVYRQVTGPYVVRDAFTHNFGRRPPWWAAVVLGLGMLVVLELAVQGLRRVYWPTDQDLVQRIEKDAAGDETLMRHAAENNLNGNCG
ncbi:haloacid dehalogenase-like hydrolase [Hirsutella rhossiliensis]|uniref:Phospholipid-transporting ATPase n=1 Tax=Hirsutella rhossiliensis TaxID=111463 RepID=A0A9P8SP68_9HYPO|nr:haloacid dehalogenase-like hydrolase domain-containing protein [Hirsutella rhossiliensis]KAH0967896.1 haloacid dehalogenase-like hydrolase domain-containing protein [Hirsutella rhossiliensis]